MRNEWDLLAQWILDNNIASERVSWVIDLPMAYSIYKKNGHVQNFQDLLDSTTYSPIPCLALPLGALQTSLYPYLKSHEIPQVIHHCTRSFT